MKVDKNVVNLHRKRHTSVKIKEVLNALEQFAPLPLQESWDNAGLQIGLTEAEVSGALLCLDVNEKIVDEALQKGCNLIVSHHPLLFRGLKQITDANDVQRTVVKAIKNDICVVSMHTNLDNARGGVNFKIAEHLRLKNVHFGVDEGKACVADDGANEEGSDAGSWVMGELTEPMAADDFVLYVKRCMEAESAMCNELMRRPIRKVAICGGAGDFLLDDAIRAGADAFITGEMHYHVYFGHEQQIQICVIGHYESEHFTTEVFRDVIADRCAEVRTVIAETNTNPIVYF
jgi:dinuclear metal center YbgI/SA1388 family protein